MLLNCDFERHGFILHAKEDNLEIYAIPPFNNLDQPHLKVRRLRKGMKKVELYTKNVEMDGYEVMWSPEQLRLFLIKNGIIV